MNYKRRLFTYIVIWSVFFSSFLIYSPANIALSAPSDPNDTVQSPGNGSSTEDSKVELVNEEVNAPTVPTDGSGVAIDDSATTDKTTEGKPTPNEAAAATLTKSSLEAAVENDLTLSSVDSGPRPFVTSIKLMAYENAPEVNTPDSKVLDLRTPEKGTVKEKLDAGFEQLLPEADRAPNVADYQPAEDMTQVRLNSKIYLSFSEPVVFDKNNPPVFVYPEDGSEPIALTFAEQANYTEVTLTPVQALAANKTYYLFVNPAVKDADGLGIITKTLEFTTRSFKHSVDIHGNYGNNTNSCANCHSTHTGQNEKLLGGTLGSQDPTETLCMACHDGTIAVKMANYDKDSGHFQVHELSKEEGYTCASCHNPHTSWIGDDLSTPDVNEANPSKIKNHMNNTYGKSTGLASQFTMCLKCHDGTNSNVTNINKYYEDADILAASGHNFAGIEGYSAGGQMPCADCHETHGSDNYASLKENLGHVSRADKLTGVSDWSPLNERAFCLKCHNGTTDMYGKMGTIPSPEQVGHLQDGTNDNISCSTCHGTSTNADPVLREKEQRQSAAHAPVKLGTPEQP
ncbi:cytochrome c3 family protein [Bacillus marasmi]|uniref:cytochrome c3 family protein n=1 Tax=Bacillus marasmi TaxID=1926279 RepID=UPI001FE7E6CF|nr:cytochrome c3 family protein [Bacillus marasmi]